MRYENDINNLKQQVDILQRELGQEAEHKKFLHLRFEEEQAAHTLSQQNFAAELQVKKEKNKVIQEELEAIKFSHNQMSKNYESDVVNLKQQAKTLQDRTDGEIQAHKATVANGWQVINTLRAELEEVKSQLNFEISRNLKLSKELEAAKDDYQPPRKKAGHAKMP